MGYNNLLGIPPGHLSSTTPIVTDWQQYANRIMSDSQAPADDVVKANVVTDKSMWRRVGDSIEIAWTYSQSGASSAGAGTNYRLSLPYGLKIDLAKVPQDNAIGSPFSNMVGIGLGYRNGTTDSLIVNLIVGENAGISFYSVGSGEWGTSGAGTYPMNGAGVTAINLRATIPVVGFTTK